MEVMKVLSCKLFFLLRFGVSALDHRDLYGFANLDDCMNTIRWIVVVTIVISKKTQVY